MSTSPESVRNLLPEVDLIKREELRHSVISVWQDAIDLGGWTADDLTSIPFTLLIPDCKFDLIMHTRVVTRTAVGIAETLIENYGKAVTIDMDILVAGGILHDVGKLLEYVRKGDAVVKSEKGSLLRHPFSGQALAYKHGLPFQVLHMIAYHSKEGDLGKRTTEAIIIHHADFVNFEPLKP
ncbi:MAG: HD domain-containing protein [Candidatus Eisenbacteria bacterium]